VYKCTHWQLVSPCVSCRDLPVVLLWLHVDGDVPVITSCAAHITLNVDAVCKAGSTNFGTTTATDGCGIASVTNDAPSLVLSGTGPKIVTWTAKDPAGQSATCTQTVTLVDTIAPLMTCPSSAFLVDAGATCQATIVLGAPIVLDNCDATPSVTATTGGDPVTGGIHSFGVGQSIVNWLAVDKAGQTATCNQVVTVVGKLWVLLFAFKMCSCIIRVKYDDWYLTLFASHCCPTLTPSMYCTVLYCLQIQLSPSSRALLI
jgi:hypothetical protein